MELTVDQLPLPAALKSLLIRKHREVLAKGQPMVSRSHSLGDRLNSISNIFFSLIPREDRSKNVLIMFEPKSGSK